MNPNDRGHTGSVSVRKQQNVDQKSASREAYLQTPHQTFHVRESRRARGGAAIWPSSGAAAVSGGIGKQIRGAQYGRCEGCDTLRISRSSPKKGFNMFRKMASAAIYMYRGEEVSHAAARAGAAWLCSLECMHDAAVFRRWALCGASRRRFSKSTLSPVPGPSIESMSPSAKVRTSAIRDRSRGQARR